jgi:hypothetical protein
MTSTTGRDPRGGRQRPLFLPGGAAARRVLLAGLLAAGLLPAGAVPTRAARADELLDTALGMRAEYAAKLDELAGWCEQRGMGDQARATRRLVVPRDPYRLYVPVLPQQTGSLAPPEGALAEVAQWHGRLAALRRGHAEELYELARRALRVRRASLALELVLAAAHANPDHEAVRRILGFQEYRGQWVSPFEAAKLRAGQVWHDRFGWLPRAHVERYEQGQRLSGGRWITAEEDAKLHENVRNGWLVETEHYAIRTNHSLEAGVRLGAKLEKLMRVWRRLFVRYYTTEAQLMALFSGRAGRRVGRVQPFQVVFFRDRDDYNRTLRSIEPNIEISIGFYHERTRRAYFFAGEDYQDITLYHEATHQLFHQSRPVAPTVGRRANFWIVEGVAMYMESLEEEDGYYVLGGFDDERAHAARVRLLRDNFYVPLAKLSAMGMTDLQSDPRIATLYSQAAGLTHFLIHSDAGRFRDALVAYLDTVYSGRDTPTSLADLSGTSFAELDRQYREWMEESVRRSPPGG